MNDPELRAYLLGSLAEQDAERLEERLLEDEELFQTLRSVEDDLVDDCARGALDASERRRFVERQRRLGDRLAFSRALSRRAASTNRNRLPMLRWIPLAAAAALVVAVGGTVLAPHPPPQPTPLPTGSPTGAFTSVTLSLGTSRSAQGQTEVALAKDARGLQLRVRLDPGDRFDRYGLELRSSSGAIVWRADELQASTAGGDLGVLATVPADRLADASYELAVRGLAKSAAPEDLGFVTLKLHRAP